MLGCEGTAVSKTNANDQSNPASWEFSLPFYKQENQDLERLMPLVKKITH